MRQRLAPAPRQPISWRGLIFCPNSPCHPSTGTCSWTTAASPDLGSLPQWNLGDLYESPKAPGIDSDLARAAAESKDLAKRFQGKLAGLDGEELAEAVKAYEALQDLLGRVGSYAQLVYAGNMSDPENGRFYQTIQERITDISAETIFFTLEINRIEDAELEKKLKTPALARYRPWFEAVRSLPAASALRRGRAPAARQIGGRPRGLEPPLRREHRRHAPAPRRARR